MSNAYRFWARCADHCVGLPRAWLWAWEDHDLCSELLFVEKSCLRLCCCERIRGSSVSNKRKQLSDVTKGSEFLHQIIKSSESLPPLPPFPSWDGRAWWWAALTSDPKSRKLPGGSGPLRQQGSCLHGECKSAGSTIWHYV